MSRGSLMCTWLLLLAAMVTVTFACGTSYRIQGRGMEPNFSEGTVLRVKEVRAEDIRRGDVITFRFLPDPERVFIKRVVGLPGERIEIREGVVIIDGQVFSEPYEMIRDRASMGEVQIPPGEYFVLGDNRRVSYDSRGWGSLPADHITGLVPQ